MLTQEQIDYLQKAIQQIEDATGYGDVRITVQNGHPRLIVPSFNLELPHDDRPGSVMPKVPANKTQ
jgi:hypothetical protein